MCYNQVPMKKQLHTGISMHFPVHEGATVVNFNALKGIHAERDYRNKLAALSFHNMIDRDGVTQKTDGHPMVAQLTDAGIPFAALRNYDENDAIVNGPNYSDEDIEAARDFARDKDVLTTLEEHPLHMWEKLDLKDIRPIVSHIYRSGEFKPKIAIDALRRAMGRGSIAAITVDSDASKDTYVNLGIPASSIEVIHNGIDTDKFRPSPENRAEIRQELEIGDEDPTILLVGRDSDEKDIPLFLKSAREYLEAVKNGHIIMCGTGLSLDNPHMLEMLGNNFGDEAKLRERLHVLGARSDFYKTYNAADVLALTSMTESRPLCISEAYAAGIKVAVSTDVGDSASMIGTHGIVTGRDPHEIATAWQEAYARRDEIGFDIKDRDSLGMKPVVAKYARVIRSAAS